MICCLTCSFSYLLKVLGNFPAKKMQVFRILQDFCALKILVAVETGGELKMPFKKGFRLAKNIEDLLFWEFHGVLRG